MRRHCFPRFIVAFISILAGATLIGAEVQGLATNGRGDDPTLDRAHKLMAQSRYADAQKEFEAIVNDDEQLYGPQDSRTLADRLELAVARGKNGESIKAEEEMRGQLIILSRRCGPDHNETLNCRMTLARLLDDLGRSHEAVKEYKSVLESRERMLGPDDLEVARVRHALGDALASSQAYAEALGQFRQAEVLFERLLGAEDAETLLNRSSLALAEADLEEFDKAAKDLKEILVIRERLSGPDDLSVLVTCYHLSHALGRLRQYDEAVAYGTRAAEGLKSKLAPSNSLVRDANELLGELRTNQALVQAEKAK
jgi:tetratricopeptide (TPR) repeat protein